MMMLHSSAMALESRRRLLEFLLSSTAHHSLACWCLARMLIDRNCC